MNELGAQVLSAECTSVDNEVFQLSRKISGYSGGLIAGLANDAIEQALSEMPKDEIRIFQEDYPVPIIGHAKVKRIYAKNFRDNDETDDIPKFSSILSGFSSRINREQDFIDDPIVAELGGVGLFGANKDEPGTRYLGIYIKGCAYDVLTREHRRLLRILGVGDDREFARARLRPHIVLAASESEEHIHVLKRYTEPIKFRGEVVEVGPSFAAKSF